MPLENWIAQDIEWLTAFRRDLHENPELLYEVHRTAGLVADALRQAGVDEVVTGMGATGVVGVIRGNEDTSGRMIGLRADMDALPIEEASGAPWASKTPGVMHACGHDGHTAMLLGAARQLAASRAFDGTVIVIFQPAEEGGAGARAMIEDGLFERFPMQEVFALHNQPNLPIGHFAMAAGPILASMDEINIRIEGVGGHAAQPHTATDPVAVMGALIQAVQTIVSRNIDPLKAAVVSITAISGGEAFNVIPQAVTLRGTVRTLDPAVRDRVEQRLDTAVTHIAQAFEAKAELDYRRNYPVTINDAAMTECAARAATEVAGQANVRTDEPPLLAGEDFAFMLEKVPGAMIYVGNGPSANLHHPAYDFNDEAIAWGCSYWTTLVRQRLGRQAS